MSKFLIFFAIKYENIKEPNGTLCVVSLSVVRATDTDIATSAMSSLSINEGAVGLFYFPAEMIDYLPYVDPKQRLDLERQLKQLEDEDNE